MPPYVDRAAADERAAAFAGRAFRGAAATSALRRILAATDLTSLEGDDTPARVRALCARARRPDPSRDDLPKVAAVCVWPRGVATARRALEGTGVRVASVATGFPAGQTGAQARLTDLREALDAGADEIDMVLDRAAFLAGDTERCADGVRAAKEACGTRCLKVILEVGELGDYDAVRRAAQLAIEAGADFVKTSTGKIPAGATPGTVLVLLETARAHALHGGRAVGVKAAGGIRTARQALALTAMVQETLGPDWLAPERFRIGASSLLADVVARLRDHDAAVAAGGPA